MRHEDREITCIADVIAALREQDNSSELLWFRGHADRNWKLIPGLARDREHLARETEILKRFVQLSVPHLTEPEPKSDWEWIFLMQHYGVPTRLLDWSESPLTALWFAVSDESAAQRDGAFWCLAPLQLNKQARFRGKFEYELPGFGTDSVLEGYSPEKQLEGQALKPVAATGPRNSRRIAAQLGNFTIADRGSEAIEDVGDGTHIWRWIIPSNSKAQLKHDLRHLRFSELSLFPDLDRVAKLTKELLV